MLRRRLVSVAIVGAGLLATSSLAVVQRLTTPLTSEPHLVVIPDIVVPIIDGDRFGGRLSFDVVIAAADASAAERLDSNSARLRSTIIMSGLEFSRLYVSGARPVDAEELALELNVSLRAASAGVDRVLVVKVAARGG